MADRATWSSRLKAWPQFALPQHALTRLANAASNSRWLARPLIAGFTRLYPVRLDECETPAGGFERFDTFFTRALKPGAREFPDDPWVLVSPCDGTVSRAGMIERGRLIQAKGREFTVEELLAGPGWAEPFRSGRFATFYLAPQDYHRVHMPIAGRLVAEARVPGRLFSVSASTSGSINRLYARNERMVAMFETGYGPVAVVMVAAMLVAGIETAWGESNDRRAGKTVHSRDFDPPIELDRGAELGRFHWGSTVIVVTGDRAPPWDPSLEPGRRIRLGHPISRPPAGTTANSDSQ